MNSAGVCAFLINALVQIPVIALVAWVAVRAMRRAPANQQYRVWMAALAASVVLPLMSMKPKVLAVGPSPLRLRSGQALPVSQPAAQGNPRFSLDVLLERTQRPAARGVNLGLLLAAGYGAFILYRIAALSLAWRRTRRILRASELALAGEVPILTSVEATKPMTLGVFRPVLILPRTLELSESALAAVVAHEMAHICRRDFLANLVIEIGTLPIAFHPLTAMLKRRLADARELACDEQVTPRLVPPRDYARVLIDVAAFACAAPRPAYSLTMAGGDFEDRIRRIVRRTDMKHSRILMAAAWAALAVSSVAAAGIAVHPRLNPAVNKDLSSPDAKARAAAACEAGQARDKSAIAALLAMLGDETPIPATRCYSFSGSGWTPALQSFDHPSPGEQAALALASISRPAIDPLVAALDDRNPVVRRNAAWAIGE